MKKILAFLLVLALGLALAAPAAAADEPDPNAPVFTQPPEELYRLKVGETLTIAVEAAAPAGAPGTVTYAWYNYSWAYAKAHGGELRAPLAEGPTLEVPAFTWTDFLAMAFSNESNRYYLVAANTYTDTAGQTQTAYVERIIEVRPSPLEQGQIESLTPWLAGLYSLACLLFLPVSLLGLLLFPLSFLLGPMGPMFMGPFFIPISGVVFGVQMLWDMLFKK